MNRTHSPGNAPAPDGRRAPRSALGHTLKGALTALAGLALVAMLGAPACAPEPDEESDSLAEAQDELGPAAQPTVCAPGTAANCGGDDTMESWTGIKCCVQGSPTCAPGNAANCGGADAKEHWTGITCCVEASPLCAPGNAANCGGADAKEHWTGTMCCVDDKPKCVAGKAASCGGDDAKEHWTGTMCCVEAAACAPGKATACTGAGKHWTGTMCCVN